MLLRKIIFSLTLLFAIAFFAACGKSSSNTAAPAYTVAYAPGTGMNAPKEGKTSFQLKITKSGDGSPATGLAPSLSLLMTMTSGEQHATPVDVVSESTTTLGTYDCTVYYMMASKMMNGTSMGTWEMDVTVHGETTRFYPDVSMTMSSDTVKTILKGQSDIITGMTGTEKRSYYIFNDGITSGMMGSGTLNLFIAVKDSMTGFPALSSISTTTLHDDHGTAWAANPITVEASLDGTTWTAGINSKGGHWSVDLASGITSSVTTTVYVRLNVGEDGGTAEEKTTDGQTDTGPNGYQTIHATPGSM